MLKYPTASGKCPSAPSPFPTDRFGRSPGSRRTAEAEDRWACVASARRPARATCRRPGEMGGAPVNESRGRRTSTSQQYTNGTELANPLSPSNQVHVLAHEVEPLKFFLKKNRASNNKRKEDDDRRTAAAAAAAEICSSHELLCLQS